MRTRQPLWEALPKAAGAAFIVGVLVVGLLSCTQRSAAQSEIVGVASIIDGDTIEIHGTRIRLSGVDAPESGRYCETVNVYQRASQALEHLVQGRTVSCAVSGLDRFGRSVAICRIGGTDLSQMMVAQGWARDWPRYSHRAYADAEATARAQQRGIWGLQCPATLWGNRNYD